MARRLHPGQKVNLDALCKRYAVDNSNRDFHGALLDARLLADVYLAMTGGQSKLVLDDEGSGLDRRSRFTELLGASDARIPVLQASAAEFAEHQADRQSVVEGKSVSVRVDLGGRRIIKKTIQKQKHTDNIY